MSIFDCGCEDKHGTKTEWGRGRAGARSNLSLASSIHKDCRHLLMVALVFKSDVQKTRRQEQEQFQQVIERSPREMLNDSNSLSRKAKPEKGFNRALKHRRVI